jgi:hypothetical protein
MVLEGFRKVDAIIFLKRNGKWYYVRDMTSEMSTRSRLSREVSEVSVSSESTIFRCVDKDGRERKFKVQSEGLAGAFENVVEQELWTGSKQLLKMDLDSSKWFTYNIKEIAKVVPIWKKFLKEIPRTYIC